MKVLQNLRSMLVFMGIGLLAASVQAANGAGPYYATPSWSQQLPASTRFIVLTNWNNEAVLDRETGLVWETVPSSTLDTWTFSSIHCVELSKGGRKGWRLPTVQELASLVDPTQSNPALPAGHPFVVLNTMYYSSTTLVFGNGWWMVNMNTGNVANVGAANQGAWCVRGGSGIDAQ